MDITGKTALVTGANRGLGRQLAAVGPGHQRGLACDVHDVSPS